MAAKATINDRCMCAPPRSFLHHVPAGHSGVHVERDMAVVEPPPRVVLHEACRDRLVWTERRAVHERTGGVAPAVAVDVEGVEVLVYANRMDGHPLPLAG